MVLLLIINNKTMYKNIGFCQFTDAFRDHDRQEQFSYEALKALYEYYQQLEEDTGEPIELDVIAICCDWCEYDSPDEAAREYFAYEGMTYGEDGGELKTVDDVEAEAKKYLEDNTTVLYLDNGGVVIQAF